MQPHEPKIWATPSPEIVALISGNELLTKHIGYWPSFTDFEVLSITLERTLISATVNDMRATFFVFDIHKAPESPERRQGYAEFLFEGLDNLHIEGFNRQNPIEGLSIVLSVSTDEIRIFRVSWVGPGRRNDVSFLCRRISVLRVIDLNPFRKTLLTL
jgi:hypothetical protein